MNKIVKLPTTTCFHSETTDLSWSAFMGGNASEHLLDIPTWLRFLSPLAQPPIFQITLVKTLSIPGLVNTITM